jgi:hypothetical protein
MFKTFEANQESLKDHLFELKKNHDISIAKQSLHQRFTLEAVSFLKKIISAQLECKSWYNKDLLNQFTKVVIQDSTWFGLPGQLENEYPRFGSAGCKAGGHIQFAFELKSNQILETNFHEATRNENVYSVNNDWIIPGALILRKLGYFSFNGLKEIISKKSIFHFKSKTQDKLL